MRWLLAVSAGFAIAAWLGGSGTARAEAFVDEAVLGAADASVTVIEYASMTCPHCASFHANAMPALKEEYVAMVARCGGADRYFAFVDVIYGQQQGWAHATDPVAALKQLVQIGGLTAGEVDACLADKALEEAVLGNRLAGQNEHDVESTPTFIVDGEKHVGMDDPGEWRGLLDPLLAAAGG